MGTDIVFEKEHLKETRIKFTGLKFYFYDSPNIFKNSNDANNDRQRTFFFIRKALDQVS